MTRRLTLMIVAAALLVGALAYLRDPPWLADVTSGLTAWETDAEGTRYRWTRGRASFFVPADAGEVTLRLRSLKDTPSDWPITATITIDDRPADIVRFEDESWRTVRLRLPATASRPSRRVRRIDIKLDRVRSRNRGIQMGAVQHGPRVNTGHRSTRLNTVAADRRRPVGRASFRPVLNSVEPWLVEVWPWPVA